MSSILAEWDALINESNASFRAEAKWPNGDRLKMAFFLSPDIETCGDLLSGRYVDPSRLDPEWLRWAKREQFVALKPALECL